MKYLEDVGFNHQLGTFVYYYVAMFKNKQHEQWLKGMEGFFADE